MKDFPNHLMRQKPVYSSEKDHSEIVFSKPFDRELDDRLEERRKQRQKENLENSRKTSKPFVPKQLPAVVTKEPKAPKKDDYSEIRASLTLKATDYLLFEENQRWLHQELETFSKEVAEIMPTDQGQQDIQTTYSAERLSKKRQSRKVNKRGLHKPFQKILNQEEQVKPNFNPIHKRK